MAKLDREGLKKLREKVQKDQKSSASVQVEVLVGLGTCGIAAGAEEALKALKEEVEKKELKNVIIKRTGCMGLCTVEPTVEVVMQGMPNVIYGNVTPDVARDIVFKHIMSGRLVNEHIYDKPAADNVVR